MTRAGKVLCAWLVVVVAAFPALPAMATGGASCDTDPGGVECLQERLDECGYVWEPQITDPLGSEPDEEALLCRLDVYRDWACPSAGPCGDTVSQVLDRCEESGVCDLIRDLIAFVKDLLVVQCDHPLCPSARGAPSGGG